MFVLNKPVFNQHFFWALNLCLTFSIPPKRQDRIQRSGVAVGSWTLLDSA